MIAMFHIKCLNSESYVTIAFVPQHAEFDDVLLRWLFCYAAQFRTDSLALPDSLSGPCCKQSHLTYMGLTTELRLVYGSLWTSAD